MIADCSFLGLLLSSLIAPAGAVPVASGAVTLHAFLVRMRGVLF